MTDVGAEVRRLLKERGWSQETLSKKSDSTLRTVARICLGGNTGLDTLDKLAEGFGLELVVEFRERKKAPGEGGLS